MQDAAAAATASYRSFAEATAAVLDLLERHLVATTVFLAHIDARQNLHRIVDTRGGTSFGLRPNQTMLLDDSLCAAMVSDRAPRLCNDVPSHPVYAAAPVRRRWMVQAYVAVPLELSDGSRIGSLAALSGRPGRFAAEDELLLSMLSRLLSAELERETRHRKPQRPAEATRSTPSTRSDDAMRSGAETFEACAAVARALTAGEDARPVVCRAVAEVCDADAVFLLEPSGREFVSTATHGVEMGPVTIQPRGDGRGKAFQSTRSYFVPDATQHAALAAPLVEATNARSSLFEPVLRDGQVAAMLIIIWSRALRGVSPSVAERVRLLATHAGACVSHAALRERVDRLALSDPLTGLATRRVWEQELPRELARPQRTGAAVSVAVLDVDHMRAFCMLSGDGEGDRLLKEAAALWDRQLRQVDTLARLEGDEFGVILPTCDADAAVEVVDRLRSVTPRGQTVSAGVARWNGEEPAELLVMRCLDALAAAKSAGRDRSQLAD